MLNWWFPEIGTYKDNNNHGDIGMAVKWLMSNGMKYILYRDPGLPLGSRNFYLHVRNDLADKTGLAAVPAATGTAAATPTNPDRPRATGCSIWRPQAPTGAPSICLVASPQGLTAASTW